MAEKTSFTFDWRVYGLAWNVVGDKKSLAVGSFIEEYTNKVVIVDLDESGDKPQFVKSNTIDHPYPTTKIMFNPDGSSDQDLLATTGDYLRIWRRKPGQSQCHLEVLLNQNKNNEFCAPLTSFDWRVDDNRKIGTSSIDTTCTIWDIDYSKPLGSTEDHKKTQLIAHDKEVFDIAFCPNSRLFASVGADGSVRVFDENNLQSSTIIYEQRNTTPLLRLYWNHADDNFIATFAHDSKEAIILDRRNPITPYLKLENHKSSINSLSWHPTDPSHICTVADDHMALIWNLRLSEAYSDEEKPSLQPELRYDGAKDRINQVVWSRKHPEWIAIAYGKNMEILRV